MGKEFIPYEQALALKELGFDKLCFAYYIQEPYYNSKKELKYRKPTYYEISGWKNSDKLISAKEDNCIYVTLPLYQQAFRWFREKHLLEGLILPQIHSGLNPHPAYFIAVESYKNENWIEVFNSTEKNTLMHYVSYEDAELECLKKLIEIVKNDNRAN